MLGTAKPVRLPIGRSILQDSNKFEPQHATMEEIRPITCYLWNPINKWDILHINWLAGFLNHQQCEVLHLFFAKLSLQKSRKPCFPTLTDLEMALYNEANVAAGLRNHSAVQLFFYLKNRIQYLHPQKFSVESETGLEDGKHIWKHQSSIQTSHFYLGGVPTCGNS